MAQRYLGPAFDVHGGGLDLRFPHHENEQAQSQAAHYPFASFWLHNGLVRVGGQKMGKSLGNAFSARLAIAQRGPLVLRYALLSAQYRSVIEYGPQTLLDATNATRRILDFLRRTGTATTIGRGTPYNENDVKVDLPKDFIAAMDDDLNVPAALAVLFAAVREGNTILNNAGNIDEVLRAVGAMLHVLGVDLRDKRWRPEVDYWSGLEAMVRARLKERKQARARREFAVADAIREELSAAGILLFDSPDPDGIEWMLAPH